MYGYLNTGVHMLHPTSESTVTGECTCGKFEGFDQMNTQLVVNVRDIVLGCDEPEPHQAVDGE